MEVLFSHRPPALAPSPFNGRQGIQSMVGTAGKPEQRRQEGLGGRRQRGCRSVPACKVMLFGSQSGSIGQSGYYVQRKDGRGEQGEQRTVQRDEERRAVSAHDKRLRHDSCRLTWQAAGLLTGDKHA